MDENRGINPETLEVFIEEITREVLERISTEGLEITRGKCPGSENYKCTGNYTCINWYKCVGSDNHACSGIFECGSIHKWISL
jgi:hypothetical protein